MRVTPTLEVSILVRGEEADELLIALKERKAKLEADYEAFSKSDKFKSMSAKEQMEYASPMNTVRRMHEAVSTAISERLEVRV